METKDEDVFVKKKKCCVRDEKIIENLIELIEKEARSCSMDFGCVTPLYVYRMWGGNVVLEDIEAAMAEMKFPGPMKNILKAIWQFCSYVFWPQRRPKDYYNI